MSAGAQKTRALIYVGTPVYEELVRLQEEWQAEHPGGKISLGAIIGQLVADRKQATP